LKLRRASLQERRALRVGEFALDVSDAHVAFGPLSKGHGDEDGDVAGGGRGAPELRAGDLEMLLSLSPPLLWDPSLGV